MEFTSSEMEIDRVCFVIRNKTIKINPVSAPLYIQYDTVHNTAAHFAAFMI